MKLLTLFIFLVRLAGIEPTTPWFVAKYSIQLSYSREALNYSSVSVAYLWWLSALLTSFEVMSTIWIMRSYAIRVGPITPKVPTIWPSTS